jgi:hypothetical protein
VDRDRWRSGWPRGSPGGSRGRNLRGCGEDREVPQQEENVMARIYNVIDADGHILEPLSLWVDYMDPAFRERAPRL